MRISTQKSDPGYDPEIHLNQKLEIFVDGKKIETAVTADTDEGFVLCYGRNAKGRVVEQKLTGKVEIHGL
jgi:hypothetical protein